jgi:hypothetical protein
MTYNTFSYHEGFSVELAYFTQVFLHEKRELTAAADSIGKFSGCRGRL